MSASFSPIKLSQLPFGINTDMCSPTVVFILLMKSGIRHSRETVEESQTTYGQCLHSFFQSDSQIKVTPHKQTFKSNWAVHITHPSVLTLLSSSFLHPFFHPSPSSVGRISSPAQLRCHGNSSLLQHLLSPTSFHPSVVQPPIVSLFPSSSSPSLCSSDSPLSASVHQRGNPFLWR